VVSDKFAGLSTLKQHRLVNAALKEEVKEMHALRVFTEVPGQEVCLHVWSDLSPPQAGIAWSEVQAECLCCRDSSHHTDVTIVSHTNVQIICAAGGVKVIIGSVSTISR
jgi:hypothetical protein